MVDQKKVVLISAGGTILSSGSSPNQMTGYCHKDLELEDIVSQIGLQHGQVEVFKIFNVPSSAIQVKHWIELARKVQEFCERRDVQGIVVTHGTDTMEETGYFLNLVLKTEKPVVMTGSMRPATAFSADGVINLVNSITVAKSALSIGRGVLVCMNNRIEEVRTVFKSDTLNVDTFRSPLFGQAGCVFGDYVEYLYKGQKLHTLSSDFDIRDIKEEHLPRVDIIYAHGDDDNLLLKSSLSLGAKGIVYAGCGNCSIPSFMEGILAKAVSDGIIVLRASRVPNGLVLYGKSQWQEEGMIPSYSLNPQKSRILLQLALAKFGPNREVIETLFKSY